MKTYNIDIKKTLQDFNKAMSEHSEFFNYLEDTNVFDIIGKGRNEMTHSKMLLDILAGRYFSPKNTSSLMHFVDLVLERAAQQNKCIKPDTFVNDVFTRKLKIESIERAAVEFTLNEFASHYKKSVDQCTQGRVDSNDCNAPGQCRLDLFISAKLEQRNSCPTELQIFIENKVDSQESDRQTQKYYDFCHEEGRGKHPYQLFVYLTPLSSRELEAYAELPQSQKPSSKDFVQINYQDLLDRIIEPLLFDDNLGEKEIFTLKEYINCLELPALTGEKDDDGKTGKELSKKLSIMATSKKAKNLITHFLEDDNNRKLVEYAINNKIGYVYCFGSDVMLEFNEAAEKALDAYVKDKTVLDVLKNFSSIINGQNSYLIFCPDKPGKGALSTTIYEYDNSYYSTIEDAIEIVVAQLVKRGNCLQDIVSSFSEIYGNQGRSKNGSYPRGILESTSVKGYKKSETIENLYIREKIDSKRLDSINNKLKDCGLNDINKCEAKKVDELLKEGTALPTISVSSNNYRQVKDSKYWYRTDCDKYNSICEILKGIKKLEDRAKSLLDDFFEEYKKVIISTYKISMESSKDNYKLMQKKYELLVKSI